MKYKDRPQSTNVEDRRPPKKIRNISSTGYSAVDGADLSVKRIAKYRDYSHLISYVKGKKSKKDINK